MDSIAQFDSFSAFPEEIRLQIWKEALPESRIIDIQLSSEKGDNKLHGSGEPGDVVCGGPWFWTTTNPRLSLPLLQVNREARRTTLESYTPTNIRQGALAPSSVPTFIDFKRDIIYRSRANSGNQPFDVDDEYDAIISNASSWTCHTTQLALDFHVLQARRYPEWCQWLRSFDAPDVRREALRVVLTICLHFPSIRRLLFFLDGRDERFGGSTEIVDPSKLRSDTLRHPFRNIALNVISLITEDLRSSRPDLQLPQIKLTLLTNGEDTEFLERRWKYDGYDGRSCSFVKPGTMLFHWPSED